jgi:GNAT superfamily N-acetyltransferase
MDGDEFPEFTLKEYGARAAEVWADANLGPAEPDLDDQVRLLRMYGPPGAARGYVYWGHVEAELRVTRRYVRTEPGGPLAMLHTLEVVKLQVPVEARRRGAATRFLERLGQCAAAMGRVVLVESVLSATMHRILARLGFVSQDPTWKPSDRFVDGENYVRAFPPPAHPAP